MSMLGHGFVDEGHGEAFDLDESDPVAYGIVRMPKAGPVAVLAAVVLVIVAVVVIATALG